MPKKVEFIPNPYMGENKGAVNHHCHIAFQNAELVTTTDEDGNEVTSIFKDQEVRREKVFLYEGLTTNECLWRAQLIACGIPLPDDLKTSDELESECD